MLNGTLWKDSDGNPIHAHGGHVLKFKEWYYWYGEDKTYNMDPVTGVHAYSSTDLYNWTDEGVVFKAIPVSAYVGASSVFLARRIELILAFGGPYDPHHLFFRFHLTASCALSLRDLSRIHLTHALSLSRRGAFAPLCT